MVKLSLIVCVLIGVLLGYSVGAYPFDGGHYVLPRLREVVRELGKPSKMDELYGASLAACGSMTAKPPIEMEGTRMHFRKIPPMSKYLDDYKITGTDERQFAKVICKTFMMGEQSGFSKTNLGLYEVRKGEYDE
jgi:hypothetical protein